jgi:hypothetical protein
MVLPATEVAKPVTALPKELADWPSTPAVTPEAAVLSPNTPEDSAFVEEFVPLMM